MSIMPQALALEMRRHAEDRADRDDAGAADAGHDDVEGAVDRRESPAPAAASKRHAVGRDRFRHRLPDLGAVHGHEGGAEALHAGEVLVAVRLVDLALAPELGLERLHGDAVRLHRAIAAALADEIVDDHALVGVGKVAALAAAPLLGGAGLVVDQHRDARDRRELALHGFEVVAMMDRSCPTATAPCFGYLSGSSVTSAMRSTPSARTWRAIMSTVSPPSWLLAAGHCDGVVEQDLVGEVRLRRRPPSAGRGCRNDCRCRRRGSGRRGCGSRSADSPIQFAPSPPICVKPSVARSIHCTM